MKKLKKRNFLRRNHFNSATYGKHMKKILHLGCSWSQYFHQGQIGIPENVVEVLEEKNKEVLYYTASHGGCDIGTQIEILKTEIKNNFDFILFQITSPNRHHIRTGNYDIEWVPSSSHKNLLKCDVSLRRNFVFWNPNYGAAIDSFWPKHSKTYRSVAKLSYAYDWDEETRFFSYICNIKFLLKNFNVPHLIYTHYPSWWGPQNEIFNLHLNNLIDFDVKTELTEEIFNSFIIDDGHHLSSQGNRAVAENLIVPKLLPYL